MILLDASVVLKWFLPEEELETALALLDAHIAQEELIAVPELLYYEVSNILAVKAPLPDEAIFEALDYLFDLELEVFSLGREEYLEAVRLARAYHLSVYDASYVALAQSLGVSFITADERLALKLKELAFVQALKGGAK